MSASSYLEHFEDSVLGSPKLVGLLEKAIWACLEDGKRHCAVLSGGIDSSSVVCTARSFGCDLPTFTGYYEGEAFDERPWAKLASGPDWVQVRIMPEDFVHNFDAFAKACKPPFQGMGAFGQFMVAKAIARKGYQIVLSGEGSDELFGGYARQYIVAGMRRPDGYEDYELPEDYPRELAGALEYDLERLPDLLAVDDQMLGAHGLTGKAPFTDQAIVDFALALPAKERVGKGVLKMAMRGLVPDAILDRTDKRGFPAPLVEWAQHDPVRSFVLDRIGYLPAPEKPWDRGWFHDMIKTSQFVEAAA